MQNENLKGKVRQIKEYRYIAKRTDDKSPAVPDSSTLTLHILLFDAAGNETVVNQQVRVLPDNPPQLSLNNIKQQDQLIQGGLTDTTLNVQDDYAENTNPVHYFPLYTTLRGMGVGGGRAPTGLVRTENSSSLRIATNRPAIRFNYAESNNLAV